MHLYSIKGVAALKNEATNTEKEVIAQKQFKTVDVLQEIILVNGLSYIYCKGIVEITDYNLPHNTRFNCAAELWSQLRKRFAEETGLNAALFPFFNTETGAALFKFELDNVGHENQDIAYSNARQLAFKADFPRQMRVFEEAIERFENAKTDGLADCQKLFAAADYHGCVKLCRRFCLANGYRTAEDERRSAADRQAAAAANRECSDIEFHNWLSDIKTGRAKPVLSLPSRKIRITP